VLAAGSGSGTITSSPSGIQCGGTCTGTFPSGTVVTLTATPAPGSLAAGWSGAPCGGLTSCTLTMIADATVTGSFVVVPANLVTVGVNQSAFSPGQTLIASAGLNNPGLPAVVDFYLGLLLPDGDTVVLLTPGGFALARLSDLTTLQPIVAGMSLAAPLTVAVPNAFAHTWTSTDPAGGYILFLGAVLSGGLADGLLAPGELLGVAIAPFQVTP
jgi:hypothetical protein